MKQEHTLAERGMEVVVGGLLAPIACGIIADLFFNDFTSGATIGAFIMICTWVLLLVAIILD